MAYRDDIVETSTGINGVWINIRPHRLYLTAERALNKDDRGSKLYWDIGYHRIMINSPARPTVVADERGRVIILGDHYLGVEPGFLGWIREDELNVPLNVVPLKYHTVRQGDTRLSIVTQYGITVDELKVWNPTQYNLRSNSLPGLIGVPLVVEMGFPPTSDSNLFRNEYLENNRYQNANQSQMVSVKLQGRPNTRYVATTSAPRNETSNNFEVFIDNFPSDPSSDANGFAFNEDRIFITDHTGEIELSFYDSELSGVNADYLDFLDYTYWVEILVHENQNMTQPPDMTVTINGVTYPLYDGTNNIELELRPGENELVVEGNGTIAFHYQKEVMG